MLPNDHQIPTRFAGDDVSNDIDALRAWADEPTIILIVVMDRPNMRFTVKQTKSLRHLPCRKVGAEADSHAINAPAVLSSAKDWVEGVHPTVESDGFHVPSLRCYCAVCDVAVRDPLADHLHSDGGNIGATRLERLG